MHQIPEHAIDKIHRDHAYLAELTERIRAVCTKRDEQINCRTCGGDTRVVCQGNVHLLVQSFIEAVLKHHAVESLYMVEAVPADQRIAHVRSHMAIAEQLKNIRVVFSADGNCVTAIDGIDQAFAAIQDHIREFDTPMEHFLAATA
jgi:hypothetical protein